MRSLLVLCRFWLKIAVRGWARGWLSSSRLRECAVAQLSIVCQNMFACFFFLFCVLGYGVTVVLLIVKDGSIWSCQTRSLVYILCSYVNMLNTLPADSRHKVTRRHEREANEKRSRHSLQRMTRTTTTGAHHTLFIVVHVALNWIHSSTSCHHEKPTTTFIIIMTTMTGCHRRFRFRLRYNTRRRRRKVYVLPRNQWFIPLSGTKTTATNFGTVQTITHPFGMKIHTPFRLPRRDYWATKKMTITAPAVWNVSSRPINHERVAS